MPRILPPGAYQALARACLRQTSEPTPFLVLADMLEEEDDPRGPLVRVVGRMTAEPVPDGRLGEDLPIGALHRLAMEEFPPIPSWDAWKARRPVYRSHSPVVHRRTMSYRPPPFNGVSKEFREYGRAWGGRRSGVGRILSTVFFRDSRGLEAGFPVNQAALYACRLKVPDWDRGKALRWGAPTVHWPWPPFGGDGLTGQERQERFKSYLSALYNHIAWTGCLRGGWGGPSFTAPACVLLYERPATDHRAARLYRCLHQLERSRQFVRLMSECGVDRDAIAAAEAADKPAYEPG